MSATVQAALERAAQLIERDGWCQGRMHALSGERCLFKAILDAEPCDSRVVIGEVRSRLGTNSIVSLWNWNDEHGRTKDEVLALLRGTR
jgi:hypothetical protein